MLYCFDVDQVGLDQCTVVGGRGAQAQIISPLLEHERGSASEAASQRDVSQVLIDYTAPAQREVLLLLLLVKIVLVFQLPLSTTWLNGDRFEHSSYQNKKEVVKKSIVGGKCIIS